MTKQVNVPAELLRDASDTLRGYSDVLAEALDALLPPEPPSWMKPGAVATFTSKLGQKSAAVRGVEDWTYGYTDAEMVGHGAVQMVEATVVVKPERKVGVSPWGDGYNAALDATADLQLKPVLPTVEEVATLLFSWGLDSDRAAKAIRDMFTKEQP